jgi:uncharacterized protein (TIGR02600 family)
MRTNYLKFLSLTSRSPLFNFKKSSRKRGIALIFVLGFLALLTIIILGFLGSSLGEFATANNYKSTSEGKRLSDVAVGIVMGQIRQGTSGGTTTAWASQPGMIRTYGDGSGNASSQPLAFYKLYSSDQMIVNQGLTTLNLATDVPSTWQSQPAMFTDLNQPVYNRTPTSIVQTGTQTLEYPIFDPRAADPVPGAGVGSGRNASKYSLVEGASCATPQGYTTASATPTTNPAPMPVKWLYILQDGTVTAPTGVDASGKVANWTGADAAHTPSASNPITSRIAFWTDDETCKLNLNTAAGNNYWDTPTFFTGMDLEFSRYQPDANEFTRYPGHSLSTSLLPVLWNYGGTGSLAITNPDYNLFPQFVPALSTIQTGYYNVSVPGGGNGGTPPTLTAAAANYFEELMNLNPRTAWGPATPDGIHGGSQGGTQSTVFTDSAGQALNAITPTDLGNQRLFASVDEMLFIPPRTSRASANTTQFQFTKSDIDMFRFFLTTSSRAPEVNMFNMPKISMWPVHDDSGVTNPVNQNQGTGTLSMSAVDNLLAYCATLNGHGYYFTRNDPTSISADLATGSGGSRNIALINYLNSMLSQPLPGYGASFSSRYGTIGTSQIVTESFDYIRSTINLVDGGYYNFNSSQPFKYSFTLPPNASGANLNGSFGSDVSSYGAGATGQVTPIINPNDNTKGLGRFPTIKQAALMFIAQGANQPPLQVVGSSSTVPGNINRPLAYVGTAPSQTLVCDTSGNLTAVGLLAMFTGTLTGQLNPMHPWVGPTTGAVATQITMNGRPVLAVDPAKNATTDQTAFYPLFNSVVNPLVNAASPPVVQYPSLEPWAPSRASSPAPYSGIAEIVADTSPAGTGTFTYNGTPYPYYKGKVVCSVGGPIDTAPQNIQTHAGLPYLTLQNPVGTGAYNLANPRYQTANAVGGSLPPYQTQIEGLLVLDPVNVAPGYGSMGLNYQVVVKGLDSLTADGSGNSMHFAPTDTLTATTGNAGEGNYYTYAIGKGSTVFQRASTGTTSTNWAATTNYLPFHTQTPFVAGGTITNPTGQTFQFNASKTIQVIIQTAATPPQVVQTINLSFPAAPFPMPLLPIQPVSLGGVYTPYPHPNQVKFPPSQVFDLTPSWMMTFDSNGVNPLSTNPNFGVTGCVDTNGNALSNPYPANWSRCSFGPYPGWSNPGAFFFMPMWGQTGNAAYDNLGYYKLSPDTIRSLEAAYGDTRVTGALANVDSSLFVPHKYYYDLSMRAAHSFRGDSIQPQRTASDTLEQGGTFGALTDAAYQNTTLMYDSPGAWTGPTPTSAISVEIQNLPTITGGGSSQGANGGDTTAPDVTSMVDFNASDPYWLATSSNLTWLSLPRSFLAVWAQGGDFDNGPDKHPDGPYINKPYEGFSMGTGSGVAFPDFGGQEFDSVGTAFFPPNKQVPSSVMFGSLPVIMDKSVVSLAALNVNNAYFWRTLLFCPNPVSQTHLSNVTPPTTAGTWYTPSTNNPPDFTYLDFFNMPVVQPYAISEPFSTAGRVNMNYIMAPFGYVTIGSGATAKPMIKRDTAMRGVLRSTYITAVKDSWMQYYKSAGRGGNDLWFGGPVGGQWQTEAKASNFLTFRYPIAPTPTLQQFDYRFKNGDIFHSPSEICAIWLYPAVTAGLNANPDVAATAVAADSINDLVPGSTTGIQNWWYGSAGTTRKSLTGTNMRDRPYATIYPQLTTKSNSFTIHYRVQVLKKSSLTDAATWVEPTSGIASQDQIYSEYRGSSLIERYVDPSDTQLPDFASNQVAFDNYYKFRVVSVRRFDP